MEPAYAIRFTSVARDFIDDQCFRMVTFTRKETADTGRADILRAIDTLATLPHRCLVAKEDTLFPDAVVRQLLYPRRRGAIGALPATASCSPSMKAQTMPPSLVSSSSCTHLRPHDAVAR